MMKLVVIAAIILFVLGGVGLTRYLEKKKWLPNRWMTGSLVFLIILIPSLILPGLPIAIKQLFYVASGVLAIIFFETTRLMLERGQYRGIVNTEDFKKKDKK